MAFFTSKYRKEEEVPTSLNEIDYKELFNAQNSTKPEKETALTKAFEIAVQTRNFEIELYWKRAAYFLTLISITFTGYFTFNNTATRFTLACIGFTLSFAWFQANRGSKQWQENWENHVDMLEDKIIGPLFKTKLTRPDWDGCFERYVTGPGNISVSKINQIIGLYVLFIWAGLAIYAVPAEVLAIYGVPPNVLVYFPISKSAAYPIILMLTISFCILMICGGKTHSGSKTSIASKRKFSIKLEKDSREK